MNFNYHLHLVKDQQIPAEKGKAIAIHLVQKAFEVLQQSNLGFYWFERKDIVHSEVFIKLPSNSYHLNNVNLWEVY